MPWVGNDQTLEAKLPHSAGSYVLFLDLLETQIIDVSRFGPAVFPEGLYVYTGSAKGSGGLHARVSRHLRKSKRKHWHIDWFRASAQIIGVYYRVGSGNYECAWSKSLSGHANAKIIVPGFGSSDCKQGCKSHLIRFERDFNMSNILSLLGMP